VGGGFNGFFSIDFVGTDSATPAGRIGIEGNIFTNLSGAIVTQNSLPSQADVNDNGTLISPADSTSPNVTGNFTPAPNPTVDTNGRATMTMTIGTSLSSRTLTLALYILAPEVPATNQSGRAFAIDITPIQTNKQVLSGQFFWLGNPPPTFNNSSIGGTNVFALWGVVPGTQGPPPTAPNSNTVIGTFTAFTSATGQTLFDVNNAGTVNGGSGVGSPLSGTYVLGNVASNGRAVFSSTVNNVTSTFVLYLDAPDDGNVLGATVGAANDTTVSFGFLTGQASTNKFNNTNITGTYVAFTDMPVLPSVPNAASPVTLTPTTQSGTTFSGNFAAGSTNGTYSFVQTTGRGTALASSGQLFQNGNAVFYIIAPKLMVVMGADQGVTNDAIGFIQF
jgi:hypothetical protein